MSGLSEYPSTESVVADLSAPEKTEEIKEAPAQEAAPPSWQEDEYTVEGGKKIKEPREMILKRAGMGYHYAQQMHALKLKQQEYEQKYSGYDEKIQQLSRWQEYNDFAEKNPEWAKHVEEAWQNRSNLQQSNQTVPDNSAISALQQKLADLETKASEWSKFKDEQLSAQQKAEYQKQDSTFDAEIKETASKYGVDLSQADAEGQSLEWRVLNHMAEMGLDGTRPGHFRAAFKDYYLDNLLDGQKEQVKIQTAKEQEQLRKAGIRGISRTPQSSPTFNHRGLSWEQAAEIAKQELRSAKKA